MTPIRYIFSFILFLLCLNTLSAQTTVNSYNGIDTVWEKTKSPYLITGNINVPAGRSLTIQPGTIVFFKGNYGININDGILNCKGTAVDRIILQGDSMVTTGDSTKVFYIYWRGITMSQTFVSGSPAKALDMQYCVIRHSGGINTDGNVKTLLDHCEFYKNGQCFSTFVNSSTAIDSIAYCTMHDNTGIFGYILNSQTSIVNSDIRNNDLLIGAVGRAFLNISNSNIVNTGIIMFSVKNIENSLFENLYCRQTGPLACKNTISVSVQNVTGCTFKNSTISKAYQLFLRNTMTDTRMEGFNLAVQTSATAAAKARITRSTFNHNNIAIQLGSVNNLSNIITCNSIEYNNNGIMCTSAQTDSIKNNIICHNAYNVVNNSSVTQNLTQNCFCASSVADAEARIHDKSDDPASGYVNYNIYGVSGSKNCQTLDTIVAKDPASLNEADTTLGVDMNCTDYKTAPFITLNTADTICHKINTPYVQVIPSVSSGWYTGLAISLVNTNPSVVNSTMPGTYLEIWKAEDASGRVRYKNRYVIVGDCDSTPDSNSSVRDIRALNISAGPNPANTVINVYAPALTKNISLNLIAMDGRTVYRSEMQDPHTVIDVNALAAGIYSLLIMQDGQTVSKKILIQR